MHVLFVKSKYQDCFGRTLHGPRLCSQDGELYLLKQGPHGFGEMAFFNHC